MTVRELRTLLFHCANQEAEVVCYNWEVLGGQRSSADMYVIESVDEAATEVALNVTLSGEVRL